MKNTHTLIDEKQLAISKIIVDKIKKDPDLYGSALDRLVKWRERDDPSTKFYLDEWQRIYDTGMDNCLKFLIEETERGTAFRQTSPFSHLITQKERHAFLKQWNIDHFGDAGAYGDSKNYTPITLKALTHILNTIDTIPNQLKDVYLIGDSVQLFINPSEILPNTNIALFGSFNIDDLDKEHWEAFGENWPFHNCFGYYPKLIDMNRIRLPIGWKDKVKVIKVGKHTIKVLQIDKY